MASLFTVHVKIFILLFFAVHGLKVIPESVKLTYVNEKYAGNMTVNIRRYTRNGEYYLNMCGTIKHTWANNITIHIIITEYLHNEYRRSFIEFHYKFCDLINKEPMIGKMLAQKGVTCPQPKGTYQLMNMTVQSHDFPNMWPFEKGGADVTLTITDTMETVVTGFVHVLFKQKNKKT